MLLVIYVHYVYNNLLLCEVLLNCIYIDAAGLEKKLFCASILVLLG